MTTLVRLAEFIHTWTMEEKPVGELNGKWSILFRATLSVGAFALPSIIALLDNLVRHGYGADRAAADHAKMKAEIMKDIGEHYPPEWLTREVESHSRRLEALEKRP